MKKFLSSFGGPLLGCIYGLVVREVFDGLGQIIGFGDLFSVTFVWIVPIIIGITSLVFATKEQLASKLYSVTQPVFAVLLFFLFAFWAGREDIICILIIAFPFLIAAAVGGFIFSAFVRNFRDSRGINYILLIAPFVFGFAEKQLPTPNRSYHVETSVIIDASEKEIWDNIVRVSPIKPEEYEDGFFNFAGIPRPLKAELSHDTMGARRTGYFEGGLTFIERVTEWQRHQKVTFDINVVPASIRKTVFDQHVLKGNHFRFIGATYELTKMSDGKVELTLCSSYQLNTQINLYSSYWGNSLLIDFQERLLNVIKKRCER